MALLAALLGCGPRSPVAPPARVAEPVTLPASAATTAGPAPELYALAELPRGEDSAGLSGTYYEASTRRLFALSDLRPRIVPLQASVDFRSWSLGAPIALHGRPESHWDGEGLTRDGDELFAVTDESRGLIERFTLDGQYRGTLQVADRFVHDARDNRGLEALAAAPSGRYVFFANEMALATDGPLATHALGTTVRIVRHELSSGSESERRYRSEPLGAGGDGENGISDLAARSDRELLVLERGYQPGYGNTVRIFRVDFEAAAQPGEPASTATDGLLPKTLVADLADLPAAGVAQDQPQPNPVLENYEAISIGPALSDGRNLLFLTSDDNARSEQHPRILVLAVRLP